MKKGNYHVKLVVALFELESFPSEEFAMLAFLAELRLAVGVIDAFLEKVFWFQLLVGVALLTENLVLVIVHDHQLAAFRWHDEINNSCLAVELVGCLDSVPIHQLAFDALKNFLWSHNQ